MKKQENLIFKNFFLWIFVTKNQTRVHTIRICFGMTRIEYKKENFQNRDQTYHTFFIFYIPYTARQHIHINTETTLFKCCAYILMCCCICVENVSHGSVLLVAMYRNFLMSFVSVGRIVFTLIVVVRKNVMYFSLKSEKHIDFIFLWSNVIHMSY